MNPQRDTSLRLEQAFQDLEDGLLGADDREWLMNQLRERPEIRKAYREHMALAAELHRMARGYMPGPVEATPVIRPRRFTGKKILAAAALIALLAVAGSLLTIRRLPPVGVIAGGEAVWRFDHGGIGKDGGFLPGTRMAVDQGSVAVTMRRGTRMVLEGPAVLEIHDPLRVRLSQGKGWFEVGAEAKGFTVLTERLQVIDFGTRFGVAVSAAEDRVEVDSGHVRLESKSPGIPALDLKTGEAASADQAGRITTASPDPGLFLRGLPRETTAIHWSFDQEVGGGFPAEAKGMDAAPIRISGFGGAPPPARRVPGAFGSGLDLTAGDAFAESDFPGISGSGPRTVALWVKGLPIKGRANSAGISYVPSVVMWGDPAMDGASWTFRAHCGSGVIGTQWSGRGWQTAGRHGPDSILDGKWHHIASVYTGRVSEAGEAEIRHYIDGRRVEQMHSEKGVGVDTWGDGKATTRLRLAYDGQKADGPGNLPVAVDELYVVRAALDDRQVESLFLHNRIPPGK